MSTSQQQAVEQNSPDLMQQICGCTRLPLIGEKAPEFKATTTMGEIHFPQDYIGKWVVFFSHPADFTPVCTTEFMAFGKMQAEWEALNVQLVGLSVDGLSSHLAWLRTIKETIRFDGYEGECLHFPLIEDLSMSVAHKYGMIQEQESSTKAVRAVFIIDPEGFIRTILYYPLTTGRNMAEIKRIVQALQVTDEKKVATPANWEPGKKVIEPAPTTCMGVMERLNNPGDLECLSWFLCLKKV